MSDKPATAAPSSRGGLMAGIGAYGLWGLLPLYLPLLSGAGVWEIAGHRVVWSLVLCLVVVALTPSLARATRVLLSDRRALGLLGVASVLLAANWVTFIVAVFADRVVDAALGYFINPLVTVLLAVLILHERLRAAQWCAVAIAGGGVLVLTLGYGRVPWIALILAGSFALYGLTKNRIGRGVPAVPGLVVETAFLTPVALAYLVILAVTGSSTFGMAQNQTLLPTSWHTLALVGAGVASAVPLMLFAAAARRLPLSTVGLLQFIAPSMQFALGVLVFGEEMPTARWVGFALVWLGLAVLVAEGFGNRRRLRRALAPPPV